MLFNEYNLVLLYSTSVYNNNMVRLPSFQVLSGLTYYDFDIWLPVVVDSEVPI